MPCHRAAAASLAKQANLGPTATAALPTVTAVQHCKRLLCVCFCCRWVGAWMRYSDGAPTQLLGLDGAHPFTPVQIPLLLYLRCTSAPVCPGCSGTNCCMLGCLGTCGVDALRTGATAGVIEHSETLLGVFYAASAWGQGRRIKQTTWYEQTLILRRYLSITSTCIESNAYLYPPNNTRSAPVVAVWHCCTNTAAPKLPVLIVSYIPV